MVRCVGFDDEAPGTYGNFEIGEVYNSKVKDGCVFISDCEDYEFESYRKDEKYFTCGFCFESINSSGKIVVISKSRNDEIDMGSTIDRDRFTKIISRLESLGYWVSYYAFVDRNRDEYLKHSGVIQNQIYFLSEALKNMSKSDAIYFMKGWSEDSICVSEHEIAKRYGLEILYEDEDDYKIYGDC